MKQIINKHWHLLQINSNLRTAFERELIIAYRQNKISVILYEARRY